MSVPNLIAKVLAHGFRISLTAGGPVLIQAVRGTAGVPPALVAELKRERAAVIAHLTKWQCRECGRVTESQEDRDRLRGANQFCDRAKCPHKGR